MMSLKELDPAVGIRDQLGDSSDGPVIIVIVYTVADEDVPALLRAWQDDAEYFKAQPGFISTQLHRGIAGSTTFLNHAVWESIGHFRSAFATPEFQSHVAAYPDSSTGSPHLFRKLAVPGLCVA